MAKVNMDIKMKICTAKDSCVMEEKSEDRLSGDKEAAKRKVTQQSQCAGGEDIPEGDNNLGEGMEGDDDEEDNDDVFLPDSDHDQMDTYVESDEYSCDGLSETNTSPARTQTQPRDRHSDRSQSGSENGTNNGWDRQIEYIICCCGFVTGLYSILKFSEFTAIYGGGVFFVAYFVLILTCGFPLLYMEMILGQYARSNLIKAWNVIPMFKGVGYSMIAVCFVISVYGHVTISWAMLYLVRSFTSDVFLECTDTQGGCANKNHTSTLNILQVDTLNTTSLNMAGLSSTARHFYIDTLSISSGLEDIGQLQWLVVVCMVVVWIAVFFSTIAGPKSLGKVTLVTFVVSMALFLTLLVRLCLEDGAIIGIKYFLNLKWRTLGNLQLWLDAGKLMFISLGLGTGCLTTLAGHTHFHSHCFRNVLLTVLGHLVAMVLSGFTVFSVLAIYSNDKEVDVHQLKFSDWELGFVVFPLVLGRLPGSQIWSAIFYTVLILTGLDTQCVYVHNTVSGLLHLFQNKRMFRWKYKHMVQAVCCLVMLSIGLLFSSQGGLFVIHLLTSSVCKLALFLLGLIECLSLAWMYGAQRLWNNVADMTGSTDSPWWKVTWRFLTPAAIVGLMVLTVWMDGRLKYNQYVFPEWTTPVSWAITLLPVVTVPVQMVRTITQESDTLLQRLKKLKMTPTNWGPGPFANQEHASDGLPDYVICTPDIYKPQHGLALLTANLYIPNLDNLVTAQEAQDADMASGYLSDVMTLDSGDSDDTEEDHGLRDSWSSRMAFVLSCLGYVVGLGNVWRYPYLVFKNGGGAFFIPYVIMLVFCGMPLVYLELAFGQYASLGPVTVWRAVPIFKGIGISMVMSSVIISIYYNVINAWAFHYFFSSMAASLPWLHCDNSWNKESCDTSIFKVNNCSWVNQTYLQQQNYSHSCVSMVMNCSFYEDNSTAADCVNVLYKKFGDPLLLEKPGVDETLSSPSEEYFYYRVLNTSGSTLGNLGYVQWELALCLLLAWAIVFICLVRGIRTTGKVAYFVVTFPYVIIIALLIRALMMEGYIQGIKFYFTPKWEKLKEPGVWADAAVQVFFSLSACMGGLTTLASYNKFHNNIYSFAMLCEAFQQRNVAPFLVPLAAIPAANFFYLYEVDAILVVLGDTLMSVLAGFSVFAMMGVLANELNTSIENVIASGIGLTFIVNPAAMSFFPIAPLWSILFFLMIIMLGLSTQFVNVETIITAIVDENIVIFRRRRILVLFIVCFGLYLLGLPLTTQGGMYLLQLIDEYAAGFPILVNGIFICIAVGWVYGVRQFASDVKHMIAQNVGIWWKALWCFITPLIITFILVFSAIGYKPLSEKYEADAYPEWAEVIGFIITLTPVTFIPVWIVIKLLSLDGRFVERLKKSCQSDVNWGPALERHWKNVEYLPSVNANTLSVDIERSLLHTVTDNVDFTTVGVRVPSLSSQTSLLPKSLSPKKPRDMRERAILNHAYSNPQCHQSTASIEKASSSNHTDNVFFGSDVIVVPRLQKKVKTADKATQTELSGKGKRGPGRSPKMSTSSQISTCSSLSDDSPAVLEVNVTHF